MTVKLPKALERTVTLVIKEKKPQEPHVYLDPDYPIVRINHPLARRYDYDACPAVNSFLHDNSCNNKIIIGAFASGKSSAILQYLLYRAVTMPICDDGIRRYKALIVRASTPQLESTTLQSWLIWSTYLPEPIGRKSNKLCQNKEYHYQFYDDKGMIDFTLYFLPLDSEEAGDKLDSFEATDVFINELRHIPKEIWRKVFYRIGRYPDKLYFNNNWEKYKEDNKILEKNADAAYDAWYPYKKQQVADTNASTKRHWIALTDKEKLANRKIYHQPPQIIEDEKGNWYANKDADNVKYKEPNHWLDMLDEGLDFALVYACGQYGITRAGKVVYPQFKSTFHIKKGVKPVEGVPLLLTLDIGLNALTPAGLIQQLTPQNQYRAIKEFCSDRSSTKALCEEIYLWLFNNYPQYELEIVYDPAAKAGSDIKDLDVQTPAIVNKIFKLESRPAKTNQMQPRLDAPKFFLGTLSDDGEPAFIIDEDECPILIEAFVSEYHYEKIKIIEEEKVKDKPKKSHPHGDIMDDCQYGCLEFGGAGIRQKAKKVYNTNYKQLLANNTVM